MLCACRRKNGRKIDTGKIDGRKTDRMNIDKRNIARRNTDAKKKWQRWELNPHPTLENEKQRCDR